MEKPEILAPVGSWEALLAAIENGADAVYLGGKTFSARQYAQNFDRKELARAVRLAHLRGVKVFVTVNILISNEELDELVDYLFYLYQLGVDGVIIQDLGVARLLRKIFPALPVHASTQMTIHNLEGARFLEELGFTRVIAARELSQDEIRELVAGTSLEVEVFVHGALCACYSGQCLMSSLIGGRSGNRGRCAQPCRLEYTLVCKSGDGKVKELRSGHLLSTRDLQLAEYLPELCRTGVVSFKIEGRMKRPEYVATVVRVYRQALDRYLADPGHYRVTPEEKKDLAQIFNRGFTTGYLLGRPQPALVNTKRPNNRGLPIGRVQCYTEKGSVVKLTDDLEVGDQVEFWVSHGGRVSASIEEMWVNGRQVERARPGDRVRLSVTGPIRPGDRVFKVKAVALEKQARESFTDPPMENRVPITMHFRARLDEPCHLTVIDDAGNRGEAWTEFRAQAAKKHPLTRETVAAQLLRLGNTQFYCKELEIELEGELMVPFSELNELRRQAVRALEESRLAFYSYPRLERGTVQALWKSLFPPLQLRDKEQVPQLAVSVNSREKLVAAVRAGADLVYFGGEAFRQEEVITQADLSWAVGYCRRQGVQVYAATPRIVRRAQMPQVRDFLQAAVLAGVDGVQVANLGVFQVACRELGLPLAADYPLNLFNSLALGLLQEYGVELATLSPELTFAQVRDMVARTTIRVECLVAGRLPLMVTEHRFTEAPGKGQGRRERFYLRDRKGVMFPIFIDLAGRMHIYNAHELCLVEDIPCFARMGVSTLRIEARDRDAGYVAATTALYRQALDVFADGRFRPEEFAARAKELYPGGLTKGHYYRGVE